MGTARTIVVCPPNSLIMSSPFSRRFIFLVNQIYFTHQSSIDNHVHRQAVARFRHGAYFAFRTERTIESGLLVYPSTYGTFAFQSAYELLAKVTTKTSRCILTKPYLKTFHSCLCIPQTKLWRKFRATTWATVERRVVRTTFL